MVDVILIGVIVIMLVSICVRGVIKNINLYKQDYRIGIICKDTNDFQSWRVNNMLVPMSDSSDFLSKSKFKVGYTTYISLSHPTDLCSQSFNRIRETNTSFENPYYDEIKSSAKTQIKEL